MKPLCGSLESENRPGRADWGGDCAGIRMVRLARVFEPKGCPFGVWWGNAFEKKLRRPGVCPPHTKECMLQNLLQKFGGLGVGGVTAVLEVHGI